MTKIPRITAELIRCLDKQYQIELRPQSGADISLVEFKRRCVRAWMIVNGLAPDEHEGKVIYIRDPGNPARVEIISCEKPTPRHFWDDCEFAEGARVTFWA